MIEELSGFYLHRLNLREKPQGLAAYAACVFFTATSHTARGNTNTNTNTNCA